MRMERENNTGAFASDSSRRTVFGNAHAQAAFTAVGSISSRSHDRTQVEHGIAKIDSFASICDWRNRDVGTIAQTPDGFFPILKDVHGRRRPAPLSDIVDSAFAEIKVRAVLKDQLSLLPLLLLVVPLALGCTQPS